MHNSRLEITGTKKCFRFRFGSEEKYKRWKFALEKTIEHTEGAKLGLTLVSATSKFWKQPMLSEEELLSQVQNGDLLLFRTKKLDSKIGLMKAAFDHIALLVRAGNYDLYLFEAPAPTSYKKSRVTLSNWKEFLKNNYSILYKKIVYRRLICKREIEFNTRLSSYIKSTLGKYCSKDPRKVSRIEEDDPFREKIFNAELIGSCYRDMNIIDQSTQTSSLEPGKIH